MNIYLKRWIESLKSDRFKKYDNGLVDSKEKSFDVLGVACFLGKKENLVRFEVCKETEGLVGYYVDNETDYYCRDVLPPSIRRQLGLSHPNGAFDLTPEIAALKISQINMLVSKGWALTLPNLNDLGCSFKDLAKLIETCSSSFIDED